MLRALLKEGDARFLSKYAARVRQQIEPASVLAGFDTGLAGDGSCCVPETAAGVPIPVDLVTTSASGLDPDISPAAAEFQIRRVAAERKVPDAEIAAQRSEREQLEQHPSRRERFTARRGR